MQSNRSSSAPPPSPSQRSSTSVVRFLLHYIADLDIPIKRGTFIEFRNGMINVSPVGRNASVQERLDYQKYDLEHKIRATFVEAIRKEFTDVGLT